MITAESVPQPPEISSAVGYVFRRMLRLMAESGRFREPVRPSNRDEVAEIFKAHGNPELCRILYGPSRQLTPEEARLVERAKQLLEPML